MEVFIRLGLVAAWIVGVVAPVAAGDSLSQCPVRLLEVGPVNGSTKEEGIQLLQDGLTYLETLPPPIYLVPALGVYRGGKSLLLNRLRNLKAPYASGFGVGHGQQTFTRGIDICAEEVAGLGSVVWMDTEGLFSAEDARSAYGPKLFSLALLFSSAVLLNSVKVLNDQFFAFFTEQQQVARVLRQGLAAEGLPLDSLLPQNLSIFWVLQQPVNFDSASTASTAQLETFLDSPGDEARARVRMGFRHLLHEVPVAAADVRTWKRLDALPDEELLPEYIDSVDRLREAVLLCLRSEGASPLQAANVAKQLSMYVDLVRNERLSGTLAKEAFEESQIGILCSRFAASAAQLAGGLPSTSLEVAMRQARTEHLEHGAVALEEEFHFSTAWRRRLDACAAAREEDLRRRNGEQVLFRWQKNVSDVAEQGRCFFLGEFARLLKEYISEYGPTFTLELQARAVDFASALQRARLVECVKLRDLLWPIVPWAAWPVLSFYLRTGIFSGVLSMVLHSVALIGMYVTLQMMRQLPPYLDVDYPVLRRYPLLLDMVMRAPPLVPWASISWLLGVFGAARSAWLTWRYFWHSHRPPGAGHEVAQLTNLERKMNVLLHRSEGMFKQQLCAAALDAADRIDLGEWRPAQTALMRGICLVRELSDEDSPLATMVEGGGGVAVLRRRATQVMHRASEFLDGGRIASRACRAVEHGLHALVGRGDWEALVERMLTLLEESLELNSKDDEREEDVDAKWHASNASSGSEASDEELHSSAETSDEGHVEEPEGEALAADIATAASPARAGVRGRHLDSTVSKRSRVPKRDGTQRLEEETAKAGDEPQTQGCHAWIRKLPGRRVALVVLAVAVFMRFWS